jgi:hypothetical protein
MSRLIGGNGELPITPMLDAIMWKQSDDEPAKCAVPTFTFSSR